MGNYYHPCVINCVLFIWIAYAFHDYAFVSFAQELIDKKLVLETIKQYEDKVSTLSWDFSTIQGLSTENANGELEILSTVYEPKCNGSVLYDFKSSRYFIIGKILSITQEGQDAPVKMVGMLCQASKNSKDFRSWNRSSDGNTIPDIKDNELFTNGIIAKEILGNGNAFDTPVSISCHNIMFPNVFLEKESPYRLSAWLELLIRTGKDFEVTKAENDIWKLKYNVDYLPEVKTEIFCETFYNHTIGAVERLQFYFNSESSPRFRGTEVTYKYQNINGVMLPIEYLFVMRNDKHDKRTTRIQFKNIVLNPTVAEVDFTLEFPPKTRLHDMINDRRYVVGVSDKELQQELREKMGLHPITVDKPYSYTNMIFVICNLIIFAGIAVWYKFMRKA